MNGMLEEGLGEVRRLTIAQIGEADAELDKRAAGALVRLRQGVTSANGVAVAGTDGFLFIANGANRWESQYLADPPVPIFWVAGWGALLSRRRGEAARRGVDLWNVVVPEKQVVLPEMRWPVPLPDGANRPVRKLQDALGEQGLFFYLADSLVEGGHVVLDDESALLTKSGAAFFARLGVEAPNESPLTCRPCLDWSERRSHLAGRLGAALCRHCLDEGWVRRSRDSRALSVTPSGMAAFDRLFGVVRGTDSRPWRLKA
ncbi:MAG: hypothetical protein LCH62_05095 [Proteobacteria bacterium]|nr:hypothetical protein [Pseudomonadota bacterium]